MSHVFDALTPAVILDAVESLGFVGDGRLLALNSYENRVYQVGLATGDPLVVKFYRPERWTDAQIAEEHDFVAELVGAELPVVAPLPVDDGATLFEHGPFRFAVFTRRGGRAPEFDDLERLRVMGRTLARMHNIGALRPFTHRPTIDVRSFGERSVAIITATHIPPDLKPAYTTLAADLLEMCTARFAAVDDRTLIRVHGDCHLGNVLWRDDAPHFVDFDDARMAPAVQDLWMFLSGDADEQALQLGKLLDGYWEFAEFDGRELSLIEPLRTLRMIHYAAWLAQRWDDPAFPAAFPWFNTSAYWERHILDLREQMAALQEPPLRPGQW